VTTFKLNVEKPWSRGNLELFKFGRRIDSANPFFFGQLSQSLVIGSHWCESNETKLGIFSYESQESRAHSFMRKWCHDL